MIRTHWLTVVLWLALLSLFLGVVALFDLPLSDQEGRALWVVRDTAEVWDRAPREALRGIRTNVMEMFDQVRLEGTPPLYFMALEGWTLMFGDSLLAARALSVIAGMIGIGGIVMAGYRFESRIRPNLLLGVAVLLAIYPLFHIYHYGVLLLFAGLSTWALVTWRENPALWRGAIYALTLAGAMVTAHITLPVLVVHGLFAARYGMVRRWLFSATAAVVILLPAILFLPPESMSLFVTQNTVTTLVATLVILLPFVAILLAYNLNLLPATAVYGLAGIVTVVSGVALFAKPDWQGATQTAADLRDSTQPALIAFNPRSALGYFLREPGDGLREGISIDLGWRGFDDAELTDILDNLSNADSVWVIMPEDIPQTQTVIDLLETERVVGYEERVEDVVFQRYDIE